MYIYIHTETTHRYYQNQKKHIISKSMQDTPPFCQISRGFEPGDLQKTEIWCGAQILYLSMCLNGFQRQGIGPVLKRSGVARECQWSNLAGLPSLEATGVSKLGIPNPNPIEMASSVGNHWIFWGLRIESHCHIDLGLACECFKTLAIFDDL